MRKPSNKKNPNHYETIASAVAILLAIAQIAQAIQSLFHGS